LLQRLGRLHRHDRAARPEAAYPPHLTVIRPPLDERGLLQLPRWSLYDPWVLQRTWLVLQALGDSPAIQLPRDASELVEAVYGDSDLGHPDQIGRASCR